MDSLVRFPILDLIAVWLFMQCYSVVRPDARNRRLWSDSVWRNPTIRTRVWLAAAVSKTWWTAAQAVGLDSHFW